MLLVSDQSAFGGLRERDAVVRIALSLVERSDLGAKSLGDRKTGSVIGRA